MSSTTQIGPGFLTPRSAAPSSEPSSSYWRSLYYFNVYRFIVALLLLSAAALLGSEFAFGWLDFELFVYVCAAYVAFSVFCFMTIASRRYFPWQLGAQV